MKPAPEGSKLKVNAVSKKKKIKKHNLNLLTTEGNVAPELALKLNNLEHTL